VILVMQFHQTGSPYRTTKSMIIKTWIIAQMSKAEIDLSPIPL
jgi:hypothetical protein